MRFKPTFCKYWKTNPFETYTVIRYSHTGFSVWLLVNGMPKCVPMEALVS